MHTPSFQCTLLAEVILGETLCTASCHCADAVDHDAVPARPTGVDQRAAVGAADIRAAARTALHLVYQGHGKIRQQQIHVSQHWKSHTDHVHITPP
eukprot:47461-Eustigmatos_ZCMA.PRE.1